MAARRPRQSAGRSDDVDGVLGDNQISPAHCLIGLTWFPSGNARARDEFGIAAEDDFGFPGPELGYAIEAALIFYP